MPRTRQRAGRIRARTMVALGLALVVLAGLLILVTRERWGSGAPGGGAEAVPFAQFGFGAGMSADGSLEIVPPQSWVLHGDEHGALVSKIAKAVRSAKRIRPPPTLLCADILFTREANGDETMVPISIQDEMKTVIIWHGTLESRKLYRLLKEAEAASDGMKPRPWPDYDSVEP